MRDLLVYTAFVAGAQRQRNPWDDYYGQRTAWQADRIRRQPKHSLPVVYRAVGAAPMGGFVGHFERMVAGGVGVDIYA